MSHVPYVARIEAQITRANIEAQNHSHHPNHRLAFQVGMLEQMLRELAQEAQLASQPDQIANYLACRTDIDPLVAAELVDGIAAGLQSHFADQDPPFLATALDALEEASEAIAAINQPITAPDECDLARDKAISKFELRSAA